MDGALPLAALIEPADAPLVAVLAGLGHYPAPWSEQVDPSPAAPAASLAGSVGPKVSLGFERRLAA
jgi:hypothetical protein